MSKIDDALLKLRAMGYAEEAHAAAMEVDAMRAGLKPFAEFAKAMGDRLSPEEMKLDTLAKIYDVPGVTLGDCRAALKALGEEA